MARSNHAMEPTHAAMRPPAETAYDPIIRAAWAYFIEDKSQAEVAELLNVSRSTVHNYLRQARADGLVRISLDPDVLTRTRIADEICQRYGLTAAYVVPQGAGTVMDRVCTAAGLWLAELIVDHSRIGVGWGETIYQIAIHMARRHHPEMTICQLLGSLSNPFGFSADRCSALLADRLGAQCVTLHAPAVLSRSETALTLRAEPIIANQLASIAQCDLALIAVGEAHREGHLRRSGYLTAQEDAFYEDLNPAAAIVGRFIDGEGELIRGPIDDRVIGIDIDDLRNVATRVLVSVGSSRLHGLRAALRGKFASHLVTDVDSASILLEMEP